MERLKDIIEHCKCEITIDINSHRNSYSTAKEALQEINEYDLDSISDYDKTIMINSDTIIRIQAYPDTPIGFYTVYHWDLETALNKMIELLKQYNKTRKRMKKIEKIDTERPPVNLIVPTVLKVNELVDTINLQSEIIEKQGEEIKGLKEIINNHEFRIDALETKGHDYRII